MSKFEKLIERWRQNPKNVRFEEIDSVLLRVGCIKRMKGSHAFYTRDGESVLIPFHRPFVKPPYVALVLDFLQRLGEIEEGA